MPRQLVRLKESREGDSFDDQKTASQIAQSETLSENQQDFQEYCLSQIKRIIHGNDTGNWHDDIATVFGGDASLKSLLGGTSVPVDEEVLVDDIASDSFLIGRAALGSVTADPLWKIRKFEDVGGDVIDVTYADGSTGYDKTWDDRATYVYS